MFVTSCTFLGFAQYMSVGIPCYIFFQGGLMAKQCDVGSFMVSHVHSESAMFIQKVPCSFRKCHAHSESAMFIQKVPCSFRKCHVHSESAMLVQKVPCSFRKCHAHSESATSGDRFAISNYVGLFCYYTWLKGCFLNHWHCSLKL